MTRITFLLHPWGFLRTWETMHGLSRPQKTPQRCWYGTSKFSKTWRCLSDTLIVTRNCLQLCLEVMWVYRSVDLVIHGFWHLGGFREWNIPKMLSQRYCPCSLQAVPFQHFRPDFPNPSWSCWESGKIYNMTGTWPATWIEVRRFSLEGGVRHMLLFLLAAVSCLILLMSNRRGLLTFVVSTHFLAL